MYFLFQHFCAGQVNSSICSWLRFQSQCLFVEIWGKLQIVTEDDRITANWKICSTRVCYSGCSCPRIAHLRPISRQRWRHATMLPTGTRQPAFMACVTQVYRHPLCNVWSCEPTANKLTEDCIHFVSIRLHGSWALLVMATERSHVLALPWVSVFGWFGVWGLNACPFPSPFLFFYPVCHCNGM